MDVDSTKVPMGSVAAESQLRGTEAVEAGSKTTALSKGEEKTAADDQEAAAEVKAQSKSQDEQEDQDDDETEEDDDDDDDDEEEEEEDLDYYYYSFAEEVDSDGRVNSDGQLNNNDDPEYFSYECLSPQDTENFLQESVEAVTASLLVRRALITDLTWSISPESSIGQLYLKLPYLTFS
jgi:hypothetical protein